MWEKLVLYNSDLEHFDVAFFLVLDGLGVDVKTFAGILRLLTSSPHARILVTGGQELFNTIEKNGVRVDKITLGGASPGTQLYVKHRMDSMMTLKDRSHAGVEETRQNILKMLRSTIGDYYVINRVLDNIAKTDDEDEIKAILETAGASRLDQIDADIEALNRTLMAKKIGEVNELITWVSTSRHGVSPLVLEGVMSLRPGAGISLMSIEAKIEGEYAIFSLDFGRIVFKI